LPNKKHVQINKQKISIIAIQKHKDMWAEKKSEGRKVTKLDEVG